MADNLPISFAIPAEQAIASYNWTDIADGTGVVSFYLIESGNSSGVDYHLVSNISYSNSTNIGAGSGVTTDLDYDSTPFNSPRTVNGTATLEVPMYLPEAETGYLKAQLFKYDGSTETAISSEIQSPTKTAGVPIAFLQIPLTETLFGVGDILRLTLKMTHVAFGGANIYYGQDPMARTDANFTITTRSKLNVPFKIEL